MGIILTDGGGGRVQWTGTLGEFGRWERDPFSDDERQEVCDVCTV